MAIQCRVIPIGGEEAFSVTRPAKGILHLSRPSLDPCPLGLNIDAQLIFDMHADGRVVGIECFVRLGQSLLSERVARQIAQNSFHGLVLIKPPRELSVADAGLGGFNTDAAMGWTFGECDRPTRYWLGGGGFVDVEDGALRRLGVRYQT